MNVHIHFYKVPIPGIYNYIKTVQAKVINITEDEQLCIRGTAIVNGQHLPVFGGRTSGARAWKYFEYPKGVTQ